MAEVHARESAIDRLDSLTLAFRVSQLIHAAAVLGVCDAIGDEWVDAGAIADRTRSNVISLQRLLRALVAIDVLRVDRSQRFACAEMGHLLRTSHPSSLASAARNRMEDATWRAWGTLSEAVRTNSIAYEIANATTFWGDLEANHEASEAFNQMMASRTAHYADSLAHQVDLSRYREYVDVGGGQGTLLADLVKRHPASRGILFDRPAGLVGADAFLQDQGVTDRVRIVSGDFFVAVPPTEGLLILRRILHDWQDEDAVAILSRCREALSSDARLLVSELILPEPEAISPANQASYLMDVHMFVLFGAKERTEQEWHRLLEKARLEIEAVFPTSLESTIIARPV